MSRPRALSTEDYVAGVRDGDRRMLARAITLVESTHLEDTDQAQDVLGELAHDPGKAARFGISGVPGVGKSTLIEALGRHVLEDGSRLAVLAVDPSSAVSGGSILGDKTRMTELSKDERAFIRPSPAAESLGGVARRTREAMLLCEAAGFDVVFVETIGVGQSEVAVARMVDVFCVLMLAGAGDELQGIKRGILELADLLVVTKADGDNRERARLAATELHGALRILRGAQDAPEVKTCSARSGTDLPELWAALRGCHDRAQRDGALAERRREQSLHWFDDAVDDLLRARFLADPAVRSAMPELREQVRQGALQPTVAARRLLDRA